MADERNRLQVLKEIKALEQEIAQFKIDNDMRLKTSKEDLLKKEEQIRSKIKESADLLDKQLSNYSNAESSLSSISGAYSNLKDLQVEGLKLQQVGLKDMTAEQQSAIKIQSINAEISQLGREDINQRAYLLSQRDAEMKKSW